MNTLLTAVRRHMMAFMLLPVSLIIVNRAMALQNAENQDVRNLLLLAARQSASLDYDADQMQSLLHSDAVWQTHATLLDQVKGHVNQLSVTIAKLQAEQSRLLPGSKRGSTGWCPFCASSPKTQLPRSSTSMRIRGAPFPGTIPSTSTRTLKQPMT